MNVHKLQQWENGIPDGSTFDVWNNVFTPYSVYRSLDTIDYDKSIEAIQYTLEHEDWLPGYIHSLMTSTTSDGHPCLSRAIEFQLRLDDSFLKNNDMYVNDYAGTVTPQYSYKIWDGATHRPELLNGATIGRIYFVGMFYEMPRFSTVYSTDKTMRFMPILNDQFVTDLSNIPASTIQIQEINDANIPGYYDDGTPITKTFYKNYYQYEMNNKKRGMPIDDGNTVTYTVINHLGNGINKGATSYYINRGSYSLAPAFNRIDIYPLATSSTGPLIGGIPSDFIPGFRVFEPIAQMYPSDYYFPIPTKFIVNGGEGSYTPEDPTIGRLCFRGFIILGD